MKRITSFLAVSLAFLLSIFLFSHCEAKEGKFGKGSTPGEKKTLTANNVKFTFCWCPPGEFMMGSPRSEDWLDDIDGHDDTKKQHRVRLTKGFWLLESEVTQEMWEAVMRTTIQDQITQEERRTQHEFDITEDWLFGPRKPMCFVSWDDSLDFCKRLSGMTRQKIVLPTEAQWEYACRAGTTGKYAGTGSLEDMGWYIGNSDFRFHEVKGKRANAWGLYDMHGNVWEWCSDWYTDDYYWESPVDDPTGPSSGWSRVQRGGSWYDDARDCRSAASSCGASEDLDGFQPWIVWRYNSLLGFRPALIPAED